MGSPANITNRSNAPFRVPGGLGEQPSVTDRDLGDESRADVDGWYAKAGRDATRIADLEAEITRLHQAHERYVAAQQTLANNACDWRDAEIERLRAALAAAQPTVKESPNPFANALTHGWATARYPTEDAAG